MNMQVVKLSFTAPVHFGTGRLTDSAYAIAADTLFSALFIEALSLGCSDELLSAARAGELLISDTLPWVDKTYYLPKPYVSGERGNAEAAAGQADEQAQSIRKKALKKLRYIPAGSLTAYFAGEMDSFIEADRFSELGTTGLTTKVNLTRDIGDEAKPYHVGGYYFSENAGLYFIVRQTKESKFALEPLLESLQYSGLGGERSSGYGRFNYEVLTASEIDALFESRGSGTGKKMLLAAATPTESELTDDLLSESSYQLLRRSGFVQSDNYAVKLTKKRDLYTFAAGSVFNREFSGDVFDVSLRGAHPVWRYAKALWIEV